MSFHTLKKIKSDYKSKFLINLTGALQDIFINDSRSHFILVADNFNDRLALQICVKPWAWLKDYDKK